MDKTRHKRLSRITRRLYLFILLICLNGCAATSREPLATIEQALKKMPGARMFAIGQSVEGRAIECVVMGHGAHVVLFMAAIHGNEASGPPLVKALIHYLSGAPHILEGKTVVILPIANPDGYASGSRWNANGVDLNRNFPAANRIDSARNGYLPLSEPETGAIIRCIEMFRPDRIISLHDPLDCIDFDGPAEGLAYRIARYSPLMVRKLGAMPGSLGSFAGEGLSIPVITIELPPEARELGQEVLWGRYGAGLVQALRDNR